MKKRLIVITIMMLVISSVASFFLLTHKTNSKIAEIYQNGKLLYSIDLDSVEETYTIQIDGENGCYNTVEVSHGEIGITSASCPDKVCVHTGFISDSVKPIACLPNKLIIKIKEDDSTLEWRTN